MMRWTRCLPGLILSLTLWPSLHPGGAQVLPPSNDPSVVQVTATRVAQATAFTDCGLCCEEQSLEALVPTANGPVRTMPGNRLPLRQTFCGQVVRYGVNDENADPRDIMLNIVPKTAPFQSFTTGFLNSECTPLSAADKQKFAVSDSRCDETACRAAANAKPGRCIHAEITPANQFYGEDDVFLPINSSGPCEDAWDSCVSALEPGAAPGRTVCVYGVYAIDHGPDHGATSHRKLCCSPDASHDRPEIHPFDAIWWRSPDDRGWIFGVFQDDSNRYSFPHCDDDNNGNTWSNAPRDVTFRFPFILSGKDLPACLRIRHVVTRKGNTTHAVSSLNVTTRAQPNPLTEVKVLRSTPGGPAIVEVAEDPNFALETQVRLDGSAGPAAAGGTLTVRVAVGCNNRAMRCNNSDLVSFNPNGRHDSGDPGSGYFYGELRFDRGSCR